MTSQPLAHTMNYVNPVWIVPPNLITIHCNSVSLQSGPPSMFVSKYCTYFSYPQYVPQAPPISSALGFPSCGKAGTFLPSALFPPDSSTPMCCSTNYNVVQSQHNNISNNAMLLHVSVTLTVVRQTFQYMDMTCSVPQCGIPYCQLPSARFWKTLVYYSNIMRARSTNSASASLFRDASLTDFLLRTFRCLWGPHTSRNTVRLSVRSSALASKRCSPLFLTARARCELIITIIVMPKTPCVTSQGL
jgi:hypothetical protein